MYKIVLIFQSSARDFTPLPTAPALAKGRTGGQVSCIIFNLNGDSYQSLGPAQDSVFKLMDAVLITPNLSTMIIGLSVDLVAQTLVGLESESNTAAARWLMPQL